MSESVLGDSLLELQQKELLVEVRRHMNGDVVRSLRAEGLRYDFALGVPVPTLREIARAYAPNQPLARSLARRRLRESLLLGSMVSDPAEFSTSDYTLWGSTFFNVELVDAAAFYCLSSVDGVEEGGLSWLYSDDALLQRAALMSYAHSLRKRRAKPEFIFGQVERLAQLGQDNFHSSALLFLARALHAQCPAIAAAFRDAFAGALDERVRLIAELAREEADG